MLNITNSPSVAVLIDADNIQLDLLNHVIEFADSSGIIKICQAYGDWKQSPLAASHNAVKRLANTIQVDRVAKDTTDKQLMLDAAKILYKEQKEQIDMFILVSGDGDFRQLCEQIKTEKRIVIGIGNKRQSSNHLQKSCDSFHFIEDLSKAPTQISDSSIQEFKIVLFQALAELYDDTRQSIYLGQLGKAMRDIDPSFESRFGDHKLSDWLRNFDDQINIADNKIQITNTDFYQRLILLLKAYQQTRSANGLSHVGQMGELLRQIDNRFTIHFEGRRPSTWLDMYPHIFHRQGNYVHLASNIL